MGPQQPEFRRALRWRTPLAASRVDEVGREPGVNAAGRSMGLMEWAFLVGLSVR
jgi:hypothetical protein